MMEREDLRAAVWHTRNDGLVQGPFSLAQMRRMRGLGWLSRVAPVSVDMLLWRPAADFAILWSDDAPAAEDPAPTHEEPWRFATAGGESPERVSFAMLRMMAASGVLAPEQLVCREGMRGWRPAGGIRGLFGGPSDWCPGCDAAIQYGAGSCPACGRAQEPFEPSHRDVIVPCGVLGVCLFPVVPLWLIALTLARRDRRAIELGRVDPAARESARIGELLGWCGCFLTLASLVAAAVWWAWVR